MVKSKDARRAPITGMAATTLQTSAFPVRSYIAQVSAPAGDQTSPFQKVGFNFLLVFIFLAFSRVFDVKFSFLHITGISYRIVFAMVLLSRGFVTALNTNIGRAMLGFTFFFGLSVPFSIWRGGSLPLFRDGWLLFSFVAFLATGGLIANYEQVRRAINALAWALMVFVVIVNLFGTLESGRLFLPQGKFANPNEMAQALLIGIPLWAAKMASAPAGPRKLFAAGVMVVMLFTVFRTGSRGAMIAFAFMALFMFVRASVMGKAQMLLGVTLLSGLVMVTMPGRLISRYKTIADDQVEDDEMDAGMRESAYTSTESRKQLLKSSLRLTIHHPLFGVGPGMFPVAENDEAISNGKRKGQWLGTHNSYTQVSCELGIPAFCFFLAAIVLSLKGPYILYRQTRGDPRTDDIANMALGLHYAMILYAVTILFEHIAYTVMLPVFGGLASSLIRVSGPEIEHRRSMPIPQPLQAPVFRTYSQTSPVRTA
jgi:O-Antigen ligase